MVSGSWIDEIDGRRLTVEVPATTANLGAGYDTLGLALELLNTIELEVRAWAHGAVELTVDGEGEGELPSDRSNRFVAALELAIREARGELPDRAGWRITMRNRIPLARGLGSSAAATVGGLVAANALVGGAFDTDDLLRLAISLEGHPDNAAAALHGGFTVADGCSDTPSALRFDAPRDLRAVLFIPELRLATADMRAALPESVPLRDAVANITRTAIGVAGLAQGRPDFLAAMTVDRIHEPYRAAAYPALPRLVSAARDAGALGACLSGAGSSIVAFSDSMSTLTRIEAAFLAAAAELELPGRVAIVMPRNAGARVLPES